MKITEKCNILIYSANVNKKCKQTAERIRINRINEFKKQKTKQQITNLVYIPSAQIANLQFLDEVS